MVSVQDEERTFADEFAEALRDHHRDEVKAELLALLSRYVVTGPGMEHYEPFGNPDIRRLLGELIGPFYDQVDALLGLVEQLT